MATIPGPAGGPGPPARGRGALYAALAALLAAFTALTGIAVVGDDPGPGPGTAATPQAGATADQGDTQRPSGQSALVANPLYETGRLMPLPCPAPELHVHDPASMERFLHTVADCLDDAWARQFREAGVPFEPPRRVFWSEGGTSPCRAYPSGAGAFYCRAVKSIYIGTSDVVDKWGGNEVSAVYASLLAHEYGHHVQGEAGLLEYYHQQRSLETTRIDQNVWTRKSELQANCLAGVFLGAVRVTYPLTDSDVAAVLDDAAATADRENGPEEERTHGSADNSVLWLEHGMADQSPGACNTWAVEDDALVQ
ncbi:neutral zinc metallopeptidase [Streptomonospora nanhaiensis]|uniref:Metalloprotease n=1 Tax=Streptomonospora nanhaiensis TaxID=1323731 RepID=A0A853BRK0_9ACTN|nr:neutral zinc metallopeptidase [Streptomonospora nanhaiensis]MBV2365218.1 neutral zinc metallopeptidase [Streptomonospora nanhaiensis]MBX9391182.1 neutral zinc metallopeptidase [Streptomonospora nanhaiensis]NYI97494.1 hypothetical protein [Streptomonospora nanhaiensis]